MRKLLTFISVLLLVSANTFAKDTNVKVLKSNQNETVLRFTIGSHELIKVETPKGVAFIPKINDAVQILEEGSPALLRIAKSIIIPDKGAMSISIANAKFDVLKDINIAPSKGNLLRTVNPSDVEYKYGQVYSENKFYPQSIAELPNPYILRDYRGQSIWINPMQYNPVTKELRVYTSIDVVISKTNKKGVNEITKKHNLSKVSSTYSLIYENTFLNYKNVEQKYTPLSEIGKMLIIAPSQYADAMTPFIQWKKQKGVPVELVDVATIGNTASAIKTYITNYYNTNGLTFVLLVGDAEDVTNTSTSSGASDAAYGYMSGDDAYAEVIIGRFSAENVSQVEMMVQKVIKYEKTPVASDSFYNRFTLIASDQGTGGQGDDGESDVQHMRNIKPDLLGFTYTTDGSYELFDGDAGELDQPGNPTAQDMVDAINGGIGMIGYVGHGADTYIVTTGFGLNNMSQLTNTEQFPFMFDVACVNGNFVGQTCFAEGFTRASKDGQPTGVLAIGSSTINQSWAPPMDGEDEMVDLLVNSYSSNIKHTFGGIHVNGCMHMNDEYGAQGKEMTDTWTIFGDPSVVLRTKTPETMSVSHPGVLLLGQSSFTVNCSSENATVCLTNNNEIMGTATVVDGVATVTFTPPTAPGTMTVTVTGFNQYPYIQDVDITPANEPYVILNDYSLSAEPNYGDSLKINLALENVANVGSGYDAGTVEAKLTSTDQYVTILDSLETYGSIVAGDTISVNNAFAFVIANNVPDQHVITFNLTVTGVDAKYTWESQLTIKANAPKLTIGSLIINDVNMGNSNGVLDPNENATLEINITNDGHADILSVNNKMSIVNGTEYLAFTDVDTAMIDSLAAGATKKAIFAVHADSLTPLGTSVDLKINTNGGAGAQYVDSANKQIIIGFVPEYCTSGATHDADSEIDEVVFGSLSNNTASTCATYSDFTNDTSLIKDFMIGATYQMSLTLGTCGGNYSKAAKVYIDWNYDGDFDDENEMVWETDASTEPTTSTHSITVPATAMAGQKYMRVVCSEDESSISACGTFSYGETEDYKINLLLPEAPVANFEATPLTLDAGLSVNFTDLSENYPTSWSWEITPGTVGTEYVFIDGTDASSQNPKVQFLVGGNYTIKLTATNLTGENQVTKADYITVNPITEVPTADFSADKTEIFKGEMVHFTDLSNNTPISWQWTVTPGTANVDYQFVQSTSATSQNPIIKFINPNKYTISLVATNVAGSSSPMEKTDYINALPTDYEVTFNVASNGTPIQDAAVTVGSTTVHTNASGVAVMSLAIGQHSYNVVMNGYGNVSGTLEVVDQPITINVDMVGMESVSSSAAGIYPNPNNGTFTVDVNGTYDVQIMNSIGKVVYTNKVTNKQVLSIKNINEGIYFIKLVKDNQVITKQFIVKK